MANLSDFLSHTRSIGFASGTHFEVMFNRGDETIKLLVDTCVIPGINLMTTEMRTFGEIRETPYSVTYPPVDISFLVDNTGSVKTFLDAWMTEIYDPVSKSIGYWSDYTTDIEISLLNKNGEQIKTVQLHEAYPKSIQDISLGNDVKDVLRLNVQFIYKYWTISGEGQISEGAVAADTRNFNQRALNEAVFFASNTNSSNAQNSLRDWGEPFDLPAQLDQFGGDMSSSIGRSITSATRAMSDRNNNPISILGTDGQDKSFDLKNGLNALTSDFTRFGSGLSDLGKTLNNITAPVSAIAGAVSSMSGTLGAIDGTLGALGLGNPFTKIRQNLNKTSADLGTVAGLKRLPSHLGTIGANVGAMGGTFSRVSKSMDAVSSAPANFKSALNKMGFNMERQGTNIANGANNLDSYADINGFI
jgi:hypothetical protein